MTDIEKKALALAIETRVGDRYRLCPDPTLTFGLWEALCRAIEQHEAFKLEVSDAIEEIMNTPGCGILNYIGRFIIAKPKPDPLVEVLNEVMPEVTVDGYGVADADELRAALAKRGGRIVWGEK